MPIFILQGVRMLYWLLSMFTVTALFAQSTASSVAITGGTSGVPPAVYSIDPMQRGKDIYNMVATLSTGELNTSTSQVAIQTTRNGLISDVFSIDPAANYTLFIVQYYQRNNFIQYIVVPVEQITEVVYSSTTISGSFGSAVTTGILPFFQVDFLERANDIIDVFKKLTDPAGVYYTQRSQVAVQTTLFGPYYAPLQNGLQNGLIPNVQSISLNGSPYGTLLLISYKVTHNQSPAFFLVVPTESIYAINYYPNRF